MWLDAIMVWTNHWCISLRKLRHGQEKHSDEAKKFNLEKAMKAQRGS